MGQINLIQDLFAGLINDQDEDNDDIFDVPLLEKETTPFYEGWKQIFWLLHYFWWN